MTKKSTLNKKLKSYSTMAGATLAGAAVSGQVVYTDVDPDMVIDEVGEFYDLDLNQDGVVDFRVEYVDKALYSSEYGGITYGSQIRGPIISGFGKANRVMGKRWGKGISNAYALPDSATIYGKAPWNSNGLLRGVYGKAINGVIVKDYAYAQGYFFNETDKMVALQFAINGRQHFGWLRLDVSSSKEDTGEVSGPKKRALEAETEELDIRNATFKVTIKDFAYNSIPYMAIPAGVGSDIETLEPPTNIVAADVNDSYTAQDCQVTFDASVADSLVDEYGLIVVKSEKADDTTIEDLVDAEGGDPVTISPDKSESYTVNLKQGMVDLDGDPVEMGRAYKVLVYALRNDGLMQPSWDFSNEFTLSTSNEIATNVMAEDVANNGDASDMQVSFNKAEDEANIEEYRVVVVRDYNLDDLDSLTAVNLAAGRYQSVIPDGNNQKVAINAGLLDMYGSTIYQNSDYYAVIVSVLKSGAGVRLSSGSNLVRLGIPATPVTEFSAHDVDDDNLASDIEVRLKVPDHSSALNDIRFVILPKNVAEGLSEERILDMYWSSADKYLVAKDSGAVDTARIEAWSFTGEALPIQEGVLYSIYPVSESGGSTNQSVLGTPAEVILTSPFDSPTGVHAVNVANNFNTSDWKVIALKSEKETHIEEYRIIAVKSENASGFDLTAAEAVVAGNYVAVEPTGSNIEEILPDDLVDADGIAIDQNTEYQFFVLAVGNSKATANVLSEASNGVSLEKKVPVGIEENLTAEGKVYYSNGEVHIQVAGLKEIASVAVTSINGNTLYQGRLDVGQEVIDPGYLPTGVYIVTVVSNDASFAGKLLVK